MAALRNEFTQPWKFGRTNQNLVSESLTKFVELWGSGKSATFLIECCNGEAVFNFSALLGSPEDVKKPEAGHKSRPSPSKQKRNQARLKAFLEKKKRESRLEESGDKTRPSPSKQEAFLEKKKRESCLEESDPQGNVNTKTEENVEREPCSAESVLPQALGGLEKNERESCSDEEGVQISRSSFDQLGAMMFGSSWSTSMLDSVVSSPVELQGHFILLHFRQKQTTVSQWILAQKGLSDFRKV